MTDYVLQITDGNGVALNIAGDEDSEYLAQLKFSLANVLDSNVELNLSIHQVGKANRFSNQSLKLDFVDTSTGDVVYSVAGLMIEDENNYSSIVAVLGALDDFDNVSLDLYSDESYAVEYIAAESYYNALNGVGKKFEPLMIPAGSGDAIPLYELITSQDDQPSVMYMQFNDDVEQFIQMTRIATRLRVRLIVELNPDLTLEQAKDVAADLAPGNHHVMFIYAPIVARPSNATGLKGPKVPRYCGGVMLAEYLKRQANTNASGIPAIHRPIAGHDYPVNFVGIEQKPGLVLDDPDLKELAEVQLNILKRERFPSGIRFMFNDCLTANGDNTSILKLSNASEIVMFIDSRLIEICKRHALKDIDSSIADAEKEAVKFLEACTTKERPLLRKSSELGGYFVLKITPREDRPDDAIDLECAYRPQGAGRAYYLKTAVTK